MPRQYPTGFRDEMFGRMFGGEHILAVGDGAGVAEQTLCR